MTTPARPPHAPTSATPSPGQPTTGQRTHRYLRLTLVALVLALFTSVIVEVIRTGEVLPSISHYFYSPARNVFVGCLVAVAIALLALSGRDAETVLLDIAAAFAPLIALIPTGYRNDPDADGPDAGALQCPPEAECLPAGLLPDVHNGIVTYAVVTGIVVLAALVIRLRQGRSLRATLIAGAVAAAVTAAILVLAFVPGIDSGFPFNTALPISIHFAVTTAFFLAFAAVPLLHALRADVDPGEAPPTRWQRAVYLAVPALIVIDLVLLLALMTVWPPIVFWAEAAALFLFALYWAVQTVQRWNDPDPPSLIPMWASRGVASVSAASRGRPASAE